jgi:CRP/FNR family transcriptional regulator, cyclic AMP receptor protein
MRDIPDNPFFRSLTPDQLDLLIPLFSASRVGPSTAIFKQGDEASHLYIIQRGTVTIQYKPYDGPIITLSHLQAGEIFGWSAVVGGQTYTSDAIAVGDVEALRLRGSDLVKLCAAQPAAGSAILQRLAEAVSPRWTYAREQIHGVLESLTHTDNSQANH